MRSRLLVLAIGLTACGGPSFQLTTTSLADAKVGVAHSSPLEARGGTAPYRWRLKSGVFPTGVQLGAVTTATNAISGTPYQAGTFEITIEVEDSKRLKVSKTFTLTVGEAQQVPLVLVTESLPNGQAQQSYSAELTASGGSGTGFVFSLASGSLPSGLSLSSGRLAGTPTLPGMFDFSLRVTDSAGATATRAFSVTIAAAPVPLTIITSSMLPGQAGVAYSASVTAAGGSGSGYTWSVSQGALPPGLTLATSGTPAAMLSGTPTAAGTFAFTVKCVDSAAAEVTASFSITVAAAVTPVQLSTLTLPGATVGTPYTANIPTVAGSGSGSGYAWSITSGALPAGLTLQATGTPASRITGTPTAAGTFTATVHVIDSNITSDSEPITLVVLDAVTVTTASVPAGVVGVAYSTQLAASGGTGAGFAFTVSAGALPAGLTLSPAGLLSGTPTASGPFNFTVSVADDSGRSGTRMLSLSVAPGLSVSTSSLPPGRPTIPYQATLAATGGTGSGYTWSVSAGALPAGLMLSSAGVITGAPTTLGPVMFTVRVTDSGTGVATKQLSIDITASVVDRWVGWIGDTRVDARNEVTVVPLPPFTGSPTVVNATGIGGSTLGTTAESVAFSPDGSKLAFIGDFLMLGLDEVFIVDLTGQVPGMPVRVSGTMVSGGSATGMRWSPDSTRLAYTAEQDTDTVVELYVVDVTGGVPGPSQKVSGPMISAGDVVLAGVQWAPTSNRLGYIADATTDARNELFVTAVPLGGMPGTAQKVNGTISGNVQNRWLWTPDGTRVVYEAPLTGTTYQVFLSTVSGATPTAPVQLNGTLVSGGAVGTVASDLCMSFDGAWIAYVADQVTDGVEEVFVVNIAGATPGASVKVSGVMPSFGDNNSLSWSPTATRLVYSADQQVSSVYEVFLVDIVGGVPSAPVKIHPTFPSFGRVAAGSDEVLWSPDGQFIAYRADTTIDNAFEIEAVDVSGTSPAPPVKCSLPRVSGRTTATFAWAPDGSAVASRGSSASLAADQIFVGKVRGPGAGTVSAVMQAPPTGGAALTFAWAGDSRHILVRGDLRVDGVTEAYLADAVTPMASVPSLTPTLTSAQAVAFVFARQP